MQLGDLGEFGLIDRIGLAAGRVARSRSVVIGIGDDAAVLRPRAGEDVVVSTDAMVEGVHFRFENQSCRNIGRRALVANLSDLAAMAARPLGFTLALAAPAELSLRRVDDLLAGLLIEAAEYACPLVGGNVSAARETSLTLTVIGAVARGRALTRGGARAGDRLCVTGRLGAAALALAKTARTGARIRQLPTPRLHAGAVLARISAVTACIDISDGLLADAGHLLASRGLAASIDRAAVPRPARFAAACARLAIDPDRLLLEGGEDYELLFAVRGATPSISTLRRRLGIEVSEIGRVVPAGAAAGDSVAPGWRHF
ncbi:MAG: thiamine-phosphate kinase [Deltaproteobacteria bacterium]|nr:thiamine-phosphate kinase [Deltaproteobacteria bacterium]